MEVMHYGTPRHSGRYPWGSGKEPYQRGPKEFLEYVKELKKKGVSEKEIAEGMKMNTKQLRATTTIALDEKYEIDLARIIALKDKGYSQSEIGRLIGRNESSVRSILDPVMQERRKILMNKVDEVQRSIDEKGYLDVGRGVEEYLSISRTKMDTVLSILEEMGYKTYPIQIEQLGTAPGNKTTVLVLTRPGTEYKDVYANKAMIKGITENAEDGGNSSLGLRPIENVNSKRIHVRHAEDGGANKDGVIELRRGVSDLDLGNAKYAQVRIGVDGTHYLKGMAMYADDADFPKGTDIIFNTNKDRSTPIGKIFKEMKKDPQTGEIDSDNPFGAQIKKGGQKGALNIVNEEGDWDTWSRNLSSQFLSKQPHALIKKQLDLAFQIKQQEYDDIMALTNPTVKKRLLESFADDCDSSAVHLKAAALPRQGTYAILPITDMKETEIYAPKYRDGETVVLIRHPHGGTFEIPQLTVNNRQKTANKLIKGARDAVGIHPKVAEQLSGADFDGDNVIVIPNNSKTIKASSPLKNLQNFNPRESYKEVPGMKYMTKSLTQKKMGDISNLITDMTIKGANANEIARAVKHSMVVIDAEKHKLNYEKSYIDNGIAGLKQKYQGSARSGASTLVSKASSQKNVDHRKPYYLSDDTVDAQGNKIYKETGETYIKRTKTKSGLVKETLVKRTTKSTKMAEVKDAYELSSGTPTEGLYANYANKLKALANKSRKSFLTTNDLVYSPSANKVFKQQVESLMQKLSTAKKNAPLERQAQLLANVVVDQKKRANPDMDAADVKKIKSQALSAARERTGANKTRIDIEPDEWNAIQAGAVSKTTLNQILLNTDLDKIKTYATPRTITGMSSAKLSKARQMLNAGYTQAEVADALGISTSTLSNAINA